MNDFGHDLTGCRVVFKSGQFYKAKASVAERTFVCESGPGCVMNLKQRTVHGHWVKDKKPDTFSSYEIETAFDKKGKKLTRSDREGEN